MPLLGSAGLELLLSTLMAPIMMLIHTEFIFRILCGRSVDWAAQPRDDRGVPWSAALVRHAWHMVGAVIAAAVVWRVAPNYLPWVAPVIGGLLAAVPFTVLTSWRQGGLWTHAVGLLVTPEEYERPGVLRTLQPERRRRRPSSPPVAAQELAERPA